MGTPIQAANAATIECVSRSLVGASVLTPAASSKLPQPTSLDFVWDEIWLMLLVNVFHGVHPFHGYGDVSVF